MNLTLAEQGSNSDHGMQSPRSGVQRPSPSPSPSESAGGDHRILKREMFPA